MRPTMKSTNARSFGEACRPDGHSTWNVCGRSMYASSTVRSRALASSSRTAKSGTHASPRPRIAKHTRVSTLLQIIDCGGSTSASPGAGRSGQRSSLPVVGKR
ncbi:Uncharacterised protein [Burkholderia pseudomallei]|nr:Uncharacterised protein [Burkholderia pseudomallei]